MRVEVDIDGDVGAVDWNGGKHEVTPDLFPGRAAEWGKSTWSATSAYLAASRGLAPAPTRRANPHGVIEINQPRPCSLVMAFEDLRPEEDYVSDPDDVILLTFVDGEPAQEVSGRWRVTAADVHEVFSDEFTIPVRWLHWREPIQSILNGEPLEPVDEASDAE